MTNMSRIIIIYHCSCVFGTCLYSVCLIKYKKNGLIQRNKVCKEHNYITFYLSWLQSYIIIIHHWQQKVVSCVSAFNVSCVSNMDRVSICLLQLNGTCSDRKCSPLKDEDENLLVKLKCPFTSPCMAKVGTLSVADTLGINLGIGLIG